MERTLRVTVRALIAGEVPDNQCLVAGSGEEHVGVFEGGREGGDPSRVTLKGALENELFRHLGCFSMDLRRRVGVTKL